MAAVSGSVQIRPVRVALAVAPNMEALRCAVQLATSAWGGMYYPLVSTDDFDVARELARISASDVIVPVDAGAGTYSDAGRDLAKLPGFGWGAGGTWGPFEPPTPHLSSRLLGPEANLQSSSAPRSRPVWLSNDPLAALYCVWFGEYGDSAYENGLQATFDAETVLKTLALGIPFPSPNDSISPLALTALNIEYAGLHSETGIVVVDPDNPKDLIRLWNLRALGNHVFPWPIGHEASFIKACQDWVRAAKESGRIHRWVRGGDGSGFDCISVWTPPNSDASTPAAFEEIARAENLEVHHGIDIFSVPPRSRESHPLATAYRRRFSLTIPDGEYSVAVPLPTAPFSLQGDIDEPDRIVVAQISILQESGLGSGKTFAVPNARKISPLLSSWVNYPEVFCRPAGEGLAMGVSASAEQAYIRAVPTEAIIEKILEGSKWTTSRSPSGRFATQLIELLGGPRSTAGNQPAVRWVLDTAARSPHGHLIPVLIDSAKKAQGDWPNRIFSRDEANRDYPAGVVRYLLARKLLRPVLPVECPECATKGYLTPESLATDYSCDMCGKVNPLGFILALKNSAPWHYKTASTLTAEQIAETMPIMATVNVLHALFGAVGGGSEIPYVLGLKVREGKAWECEVDLVLLANNRGAPVVIIGEVKSYRDPISATDLANLSKVQQYFRSEGIECIILAATLREKFEGDELQALRNACTQSPGRPLDRFASLRPTLPIVLTARDLSAPEHTEHHPTRWGVYDALERAEASCRRNLGLSDMDYVGDIGGSNWRLSWTEESGSAD